MFNADYVFDRYEEDAEHLLNALKKARTDARRWREIAELLMSRNMAEVGVGRRMFAALQESE